MAVKRLKPINIIRCSSPSTKEITLSFFENSSICIFVLFAPVISFASFSVQGWYFQYIQLTYLKQPSIIVVVRLNLHQILNSTTYHQKGFFNLPTISFFCK
jgi:hypothetical protein